MTIDELIIQNEQEIKILEGIIATKKEEAEKHLQNKEYSIEVLGL